MILTAVVIDDGDAAVGAVGGFGCGGRGGRRQLAAIRLLKSRTVTIGRRGELAGRTLRGDSSSVGVITIAGLTCWKGGSVWKMSG